MKDLLYKFKPAFVGVWFIVTFILNFIIGIATLFVLMLFSLGQIVVTDIKNNDREDEAFDKMNNTQYGKYLIRMFIIILSVFGLIYYKIE